MTAATDLGVGDVETPTLLVTPGDGTTAGTLTVTDPDGTTSTPVVSAGAPSGGAVLLTAAPVTYSAAGKWLLYWQVTGTGAGTEDRERYVVAAPTVAGWPGWAPGLSDVAAHIPYLTVDVRTPGVGDQLETFTAHTCPTDVQANRHLRDAVTSVSAAAGTVGTDLYGQARLAAALRAAAAVQRAYPRSPDDLATADTLDRRADAELRLLVAANQAAGAATVPPALLPRYAFPDAPVWGDLDL